MMTGIRIAKKASLNAFQTPEIHSFGVILVTSSKPLRRAIMAMVIIKVIPMKIPGRIPAINKLPMETFATNPYTINGMDGGIMTPNSPEEAVIAVAKFLG